MRFIYLFFAVVPLLTGCHPSYLKVRSEPLFPSDLASEKINTPDPWRDCYYGQQIVINWNIPKFLLPSAYIRLQVRFRNYELQTYEYPLETASGYLTFKLINEDYWTTGGFLSYKVELFRGDSLLDCWQHHVWATIINIGI